MKPPREIELEARIAVLESQLVQMDEQLVSSTSEQTTRDYRSVLEVVLQECQRLPGHIESFTGFRELISAIVKGALDGHGVVAGGRLSLELKLQRAEASITGLKARNTKLSNQLRAAAPVAVTTSMEGA